MDRFAGLILLDGPIVFVMLFLIEEGSNVAVIANLQQVTRVES